MNAPENPRLPAGKMDPLLNEALEVGKRLTEEAKKKKFPSLQELVLVEGK
jgi:hypothetical protein